MKYAIIDIGSNSVRLMLWADGKTLYKRVATTRLGEGIAGGVLQEKPMERTARAIAEYATAAFSEGAEVYAFATAAVRAGKNGSDFCARVKRLCGLDIDVVSGEEEAQLAVLGALGDKDGGIIDIGGASTEVCARKGQSTSFSVSLPVGAVRLFDACADDKIKLESAIEGAIAPLKGVSFGGTVYAVGGTASTLASLKAELTYYNASLLQHLPLTAEWVRETVQKLLCLTGEERGRLKGMDPARADIIAGGALLLHKIMEKLSLAEVHFSDSDNLEGYLLLRGLI